MADRNTKIRGSQILDATVTEDELNASVAGTGIAGGAGTPLSVDLDEVSEVAVDVANDYVAFLDNDDNGDTKKESIADLVTAMAGSGLSATSGVLAVDLNEADAAIIDVAADSFTFIDADDSNNTKKESIADFIDLIDGVGLSASSGVLAVDLQELGEAAVDVAVDYFAFIDISNGSASQKDSIADLVSGMAGNGLSASSGVLTIDLDGSTLSVGAGGLKLADLTDGNILVGNASNIATGVAMSGDASITNAGVVSVTDLTITSEAQGDLLYFDGANWVRLAESASAGYVLTSDAAGGLSWTAKTSVGEDYIQEGEISFEDESANCNGSATAFTLDNSPVANSVQVFLNGLLQQEGAGKDYELSGTTVTFAVAPETNDILLIHYINT